MSDAPKPATTPQKGKGPNKRSLARLAAVQAIYQLDVSGSSLTSIVAEYETFRLGQEIDGEQMLEADVGWFRNTVAGVVQRQKVIDPLINHSLPNAWPLARMDTTLRAILRCGVLEFLARRDVPAKVIISEYVDVTKAFFEGDEPKIVNGVLDRIGRQRREGELDGEEVEAKQADAETLGEVAETSS
ncbi:MAG: transcription antitermination factor NusB [Pseudomonadota bacterium]